MNNQDPKQKGRATEVRNKYDREAANHCNNDANIGRVFFEELWNAIQQDYQDMGRCYYVEDVARGQYEWIRLVELSLIYTMRKSDQFPRLNQANLPHLRHSWYDSMNKTEGSIPEVREQARWLIERKAWMGSSIGGRNTAGNYQPAGGGTVGRYGGQDRRIKYRQERTGDVSGANSQWNDRQRNFGWGEQPGQPNPPVQSSNPAYTQGGAINISQAQTIPVRFASQPRPDQQPWADQQAQSAQQPQPDTEQQAREQQWEQEREQHIRLLREMMRQERLAWDAQVANQPDLTLTHQLEQTRGDMVTTINGLKRDWGRMLEESYAQLQLLQQQQEAVMEENIRRMKEEQHQLAGSLRNWQRSLYIANFKELANCYAQLYRIVIRQESQCAELEAQGELRTADKELKESLTTFRRIFEKALGALDLFILVPKPGDAYDDVIHIPEQQSGAEAYPAGATVAECVIPGIVHRPENAEDDDDCDVICRATVRLNN